MCAVPAQLAVVLFLLLIIFARVCHLGCFAKGHCCGQAVHDPHPEMQMEEEYKRRKHKHKKSQEKKARKAELREEKRRHKHRRHKAKHGHKHHQEDDLDDFDDVQGPSIDGMAAPSIP